MVRLYPGDPFLDDEGAKEGEAVVKGKQRLEVVPGLPAPVAVPAFAGVPVGLPRMVARVEDGLDWAGIAGAPGGLVLTCQVSEVGEGGRRPGRARPQGRRARVGDRRRHHARAAHRRQHPRRRRVGPGRRCRARPSSSSVTPSRRPSGWAGSSSARSTAGGCSSRAPGTRPACCRTRCAPTAPSRSRSRPSRSSRRRTPAPMERAIKGLVTGRYLWVVFTSTNAVKAVREKLEDFGLDARAFAGRQGRCRRRRDRRRAGGVRHQARAGAVGRAELGGPAEGLGCPTTTSSTRSTGSSCRAPTSPPTRSSPA